MKPGITFLTLGVDDFQNAHSRFVATVWDFRQEELSEPKLNTAPSSSSTASMA